MATDRNWPISRTLLLCFSMMKLLNLGLHIVPLDRSAASAFDIAEAVPISGNGGISQYRSEEHTSELQSLMRISYAVFCFKKKKLKNLIILYELIEYIPENS